MATVAHLAALPDIVERRLLSWLREPELLVVAQLGHIGLHRSAREDAHWQSYYDKRVRSKDAPAGAAASQSSTLASLPLFERVLRARHLDAFRKPPSPIFAVPVPAPVTNCLPIARSSGTELVFVSATTTSRICLHSRAGNELASEVLAQEDSIQMLPPSIAEVIDNGGVPAADASPAQAPLAAPTGLSGIDAAPLPPAKEKRKQKGSKRSSLPAAVAGSPSSASSVSAGSPHLDFMAVSSPSLRPAPTSFASMEVTSKGAVAIDLRALGSLPTEAEGGEPNGAEGDCEPSSTSVPRVLRIDKWGDVYRKAFIKDVPLGAPLQQPRAYGGSIGSASSSAACEGDRGMMTCCSSFGDGRYVLVGTQSLGTLLWDLKDVDGTAVHQAAEPRQALRKQGKPCLTCGQLGHWASSCPLKPSKSKPSAMKKAALAKAAAENSQAAAAPHVATLATDLGPLSCVSGLITADLELLVCSASASEIVADMADRSGSTWVRIFKAAVPVVPSPGGDSGLTGPSLRVQHLQPLLDCTGQRRVLCWAATEETVAVVGAACPSLEEDSVPLAPVAQPLGRGISAMLMLRNPPGLLCGTDGGRIMHWRRNKDDEEEAVANSSGTGSVGSIELAASSTTVGSKSTVKVTCLGHDYRLPVFLSGGADGSVKIWDVASLACLRTLPFFGQGFVACVSPLVHAPARGLVASFAGPAPRLQVAWFGEATVPASASQKGADRTGGGRQYAENPGKASTCEDWRGVRPNSRKHDLGYGASDYQHRGAQRKERRDLGARVKKEVWQPSANGTKSAQKASLSAEAAEAYDEEYDDYDYEDYDEYYKSGYR